MEVLNYQTQPILDEPISISNTINRIDSIQEQVKEPIIGVLNKTLEAVNETIKQTIEKVQTEKPMQILSETHFEDEWNFLYFIRILFYLLVILKVIELVFSKRRKMDIQERVYRKYIFSHGEMIREFNEDDRKNMDITLKNTIKNATLEKTHVKNIKKNSIKKVNFFETKNQYFEPKKNEENNEEDLSPLQVFLSRPVKVEPVQNEPEEEPEEREFEIIETINENHETEEESGIFFEHEKVESSITETTAEGSTLEPPTSHINESVHEHCEKIEINI